MNNSICTTAFEEVSKSGLCYMTIAGVEEYVSQVKANCSAQLAEKWIGWFFTCGDIKIIESTSQDFFSEEFTSLVGDAYNSSGLGVAPASAAALARVLGIPVVTVSKRYKFEQLERENFCQVMWIQE